MPYISFDGQFILCQRMEWQFYIHIQFRSYTAVRELILHIHWEY